MSWCPRNPALFGSSSFDGHVSIYSLYGSPQQVQTSNKIADSFPGMELYSHTPVSQSHGVPFEMRKVPKWLKKPVGAKFGVRTFYKNNFFNRMYDLYFNFFFYIQCTFKVNFCFSLVEN